MKKFVFIYQGKTRPEEMNPDDMKAMMDKWMAWFGTFKDQMVDGGNPFAPDGQSVSADGVGSIPANMPSAKGYTIINANDMAEATKIAQGCPVLMDDSEGSVQVYEAMPM